MSDDGSGVTQLSDDPFVLSRPQWSADGTQVVFESNGGVAGNVDLYVANADGTGVMRLTTDPAPESAPSWSPVAIAPPSPPAGAVAGR